MATRKSLSLPGESPWDLRQFLTEARAFLPEKRSFSPGEGRRFRQRREAASLSRQETAELLGLHPATLGKWERGECRFCQVPQAPSLQLLRLWTKQGTLRQWLLLLQMRKRLRMLRDPFLRHFFLQMRQLCLLPQGYQSVLPRLQALIRTLELGILTWAGKEGTEREDFLPLTSSRPGNAPAAAEAYSPRS